MKKEIEVDTWYNIKTVHRTFLPGHWVITDSFEAKFNGSFWIDINGKEFPMWDVIEINQDLAF